MNFELKSPIQMRNKPCLNEFKVNLGGTFTGPHVYVNLGEHEQQQKTWP